MGFLELFLRERKLEFILRSVWMFGNMFVYLFYAKRRIHVYSTMTRDGTLSCAISYYHGIEWTRKDEIANRNRGMTLRST